MSKNFKIYLPALIIIFVFVCIPLLCSLMLIVIKSSPVMSSLALADVSISKVIMNTISLFVLPIGITALCSYAIATCTCRFNIWLQLAVALLFFLAASVPTTILDGIAINIFESRGVVGSAINSLFNITERRNLLTRPELYPFIYTLLFIVKNLWIPLFMSLLNKRPKQAVFIWMFFQFTMLFKGYNEIQIGLSNPLVYSSADTLSILSYRCCLIGDFYPASAIDLICFLSQAVLNVTLMRLVKHSHGISDATKKESPRTIWSGFRFIVLVLIEFMLLGYFLLLIKYSSSLLSQYSTDIPTYNLLPEYLSNSLVYSFSASLFSAICSIVLARPLELNRSWYKSLLTICMAWPICGGAILFTLNSFNFMNNMIVLGCISGISFWHPFIVNHYSSEQNVHRTLRQYITTSRVPVAFIMAFTFVRSFTDILSGMLVFSTNKATFAQLFWDVLIEGDTPATVMGSASVTILALTPMCVIIAYTIMIISSRRKLFDIHTLFIRD